MKDFSYGARAKIGLIYPAPGWVMEPEFYAMSPEGVITCTTRISLLKADETQLRLIGHQAVEAAKLISEAPVDVIALGCTSGSFIGGKEYDHQLIKDMENASKGVPCITTSSAVTAALRTLEVKKIAVATPYIKEVNLRAKQYLEDQGFTVTHMIGLDLLYDQDIDSQSLETVYKTAKKADAEDAEAIALLCTGLRTIDAIKHLETDLGKPVVSAIQSTFWHALRTVKVMDKIVGYGSLLENH